MPFYDSNFNRVHVTVTRPDEVQRIYAVLKDRLNSVFVPEPDQDGHTSIGISQAAAQEAADNSVRPMLSREFPGSEEWIEVEARVGPGQS
jgi:hypothetical protein